MQLLLPTLSTMMARRETLGIGAPRPYSMARVKSFTAADEVDRDAVFAWMVASGMHTKEVGVPEFEMLCSSLRWSFSQFFRNEVARLACTIELRAWVEKHGAARVDQTGGAGFKINTLGSRAADRTLLLNAGGPENVYALTEGRQWDTCNYAQVKDANGKVVSEKNDLHWLDLPHKDYAIVVFAQTLEHLQHPLVAMRRIFAHMRPGGYLIANQPYHNRLHADPWHFSQLSGDALAALYELAGFEILEYSEWGTTEYLNINYVKSHWPNIDQCPADGGTFDSQGDSAAAVTNFLLRKPEARSRFRARSGASIPSATSFDPQIISGAGHTYAPVPAQVLLDMHAKFRVTQGVASGLLGVGYGRAASLALGSQAKLLSFARRHKLDSYPTPQVVAAVLFGAWAEKHAADRGGACKLLVLHGCDGVLYYTARHGGAESRASALTAIQRVAGSGSACPITEVRHALGAPPQAPAKHADLQSLLVGEVKYTAVLVQSALEFTLHPALVLRRVWHALAPHGLIFVSHDYLDVPGGAAPYRMRHMTGDGLLTMLTSCGFEVLEYGEWGNVEYEVALIDGRRPTVAEMKLVKSQPRHLVQSYAVARKIAT